jgi:protein tyrosine phosphatase (PTP) superfamily phosphohydrolase (DUF442 family)
MIKYFVFQICIFLCVFCLYGCCLAEGATDTPTEEPQQREWATPIELEGVPNLHKVSDVLYRGAQPTAEGMQALKELGITTVVNLRAFHSDRDEIGDIELVYEHIPMIAIYPNEEDILQFLDIVTDDARTPVFVHCMHGADRTGLMNAIYRIILQDWAKKEAIEEMTEGGFGFHGIFQNLVRYIERLDIEELKQEAGLEEEQKETAESLKED